MSHEGKSSMVIPLGISAIDVLCCAMISSFVMFLVFAGTASRRPQHAEQSGNGPPAIVLRMRYDKPESLFNLILYPAKTTQSSDRGDILLWTDESSTAEVRGAQGPKSESSTAGGWSWTATPALEEALLIIEQPVPRLWNVDVSYADAPTLEDATVNIDIYGKCTFERVIKLHPGQTIDINELAPSGSCSAKESLGH
jgi:hypothetical protein